MESNCGTLDGCDYCKESFMQWRYFLKEVLHTTAETLPHGMILMAFGKF